MDSVELQLPWPPSLNGLWRMGRGRSFGRPNWYVTKQAEDFKAQVLWELSAKKAPKFDAAARLCVTAFLHAPTNRSYDIDNKFKIIGDVLQEAGIYENDSQIDELRILRRNVLPPYGCVNLHIQRIPEPQGTSHG